MTDIGDNTDNHEIENVEDEGAQNEERDEFPDVSEEYEDDHDMDEPTDNAETRHEYSLRGNRERSYAHRLDHQMDMTDGATSYLHVQLLQQAIKHATTNVNDRTPIHSLMANFIFTQMSAKAGIKKHGQRAIDALLKELTQLDNQDTFDPQDASKLTPQQKKAALRSVNVIKEKRCGKLKGRSCADGRPQRTLYDKSETASPALSVDALIMSLVIDAQERRKVITADIAGAYLNAYMKDFVLMRLTGGR